MAMIGWGTRGTDGTMRRWPRFLCRIGAVLILATPLAMVVAGPTARAQSLTQEVARALRVEWRKVDEPWRRKTIEGYVYNDSAYRVGSVRLRVEALDGADQPIGETFGWVYGNIASGGRWPFSLPLPRAGENFRVSVESFVLVAREGPREAP
jgi:hypothetical protein